MPTEGEALNGDIPHQQQCEQVEESHQQQHHQHEQVRKNQHSCPQCGLLINSAASLQVHMQYQHEDMNRWGVPASVQPTASSSSSTTTSLSSTTNGGGGLGGGSSGSTNLPSASPTDSENNNQPPNKQLLGSPQFLQPTIEKNLNSAVNNATVSAAADSSDNQPLTPQPQATGTAPSVGGGSGGIESYQTSPASSYQSGVAILPPEMHPYPAYMHSYDQFYHPPPNMDYTQSAIYANSQTPIAPPNQEYKIVPSTRYHPYMNNSSLHQHQHHAASNGNAVNNASSTASNSSLSPRVVSSSSPTQNAIIGQTPQESSTAIQTGQPTPSPSPKQCDKCGMVCQTHAHLNEHYTTAHGIQPPHESTINRSGEESDMQGQYSYQPYIKEEPASDILDLDSQKMVYPPQHDTINQEPLPPMHSMHPMHRSLMWGSPEMHSGYMPHPQPDMKPAYYSPIKQNYPTIKQEFPNGPGGFTGQMIKSEFNTHHQSLAQQQPRTDIKSFGADISSGGNPVTSSPSEFPSTTTPQDNGPQFRGFEPPTSSLTSNTGSTKSATWKSNEARRPKTYNCTACNKWFTSSGHLKRHYNTTLHKNAVKSSGQPDPATMPISAHHHPSRDPNSKHHHRNNQANQPPPAPPEPPRSPEYNPQYTPPPNSFSQPPQGFQQYTTLHTSANGHPNGQAGPSVHASQPRGLLIISNTAATSTSLEEQEVQHLQHQQEHQYTNLQQQQQIMEEQQQHQQQLQVSSSNNTNNSLDLHHQQQSPGQVHIISMSPQHQQHMLQPLPQQQQQLEDQAIISTMDTTPTTTTTIINTMDQQFIITSPLAINTNITQSYQHLQLPEEHQLNYHTIIGNEADELDNSSPNNDALLELTTYGMDNEQQHQHEIVSVHRLPSGMVTYQDSMSLPYSPVVPESCLYSTQIKCDRSPEVGDIAPEMSPYSPTITSTKTVLPTPPTSKRSATSKTAAATAKRRKVQQKKTADLIPTPTTMSTYNNYAKIPDLPASPTGEIRCDECNKYHLQHWTCRKRMYVYRA